MNGILASKAHNISMFASFSVKISNLWNHAGFRRYFANTAWLFAEKILRMVVGLFVGVWVARYLGPEKFGLLSYAQSFVALFGAIATLGLDGIVVRELVKDESKRDVLLGTSFILKLLGAFLVFLVLAIAVRFTKNDAFTNLLIFIIATGLIFQSFNVIDLYFQSKVLSKFAVWANTVSFLTTSLIKIFLLIMKAPIIAFAAVSACDTLIAAIGYIYFYSKNRKDFLKWKFDLTVSLNLLKESCPIIVSVFFTNISLKVTPLMLKFFLSDFRSVGLYMASLNIVQLWLFIPVIISQSLFPSLVMSNQMILDVRKKIIATLLIWSAIVIVLLVIFFAKQIIKFLYGYSYIYASNLLRIHILSLIFIFFVNLRKKILLVSGETSLIMKYTVCTGMSMILLSILLIKKIGIMGAPVSYVLSWTFNVLLFPMLLGRFSKDVLLFLNAFNPISIKKIFINGSTF